MGKKKILDRKIIEKIMISLLEKFDVIVTVVEETKDLSKLIIQNLIGTLKSFEKRLIQQSKKFVESAC